MGKVPSVIAGFVGLGGAAALFLASGTVGAPGGPDAAALKPIAGALDARIRETAAAVHSRASTLAELPRLSPAVSTDAATVQDLTQEELAFRVKPGETIEIGQIRKSGQVVSLLKLPAGAEPAPRLDRPGPSVKRAPSGLYVSYVVSVTPQVQAEVDHGAVAITWLLDIKDSAGALAALRAPARIELDGEPVAVSGGAIAPGAPVVWSAVDGDLGRGLRVVAALQPASVPPGLLRLTAGLCALLGLGLAALLWRAGRRAPAPTAETPAPAEAGLALRATEAVLGAGSSLDQFGPYSLIRRIGSGGMAQVYLARKTGEAGFEKKVALKIMHSELAALPAAVEHFLDEARLAARLSHPNIVQITDLGRRGEALFIAMEYVDGCDLDELRRRCSDRGAPIPPRFGLAILRKICDGLHAAHQATGADGALLDLVHRDVKSQNVLISKQGEVKITDFGIAKASESIHTTQIGQVKGTPAYMAPEHRVGEAIDRRADVYGVGAVAYEVLTGETIDLDLANLAHLGKQGWPHLTPPTQVRPELPVELDEIIFKALAYGKEDRYPSCAALEDALEAAAEKHGLVASDKQLVQWIEGELAS